MDYCLPPSFTEKVRAKHPKEKKDHYFHPYQVGQAVEYLLDGISFSHSQVTKNCHGTFTFVDQMGYDLLCDKCGARYEIKSVKNNRFRSPRGKIWVKMGSVDGWIDQQNTIGLIIVTYMMESAQMCIDRIFACDRLQNCIDWYRKYRHDPYNAQINMRSQTKNKKNI